MKVVITDAAFADLAHIGREIRKDSPRRAETFVADLYDRCQRLGAMPLAFPLLPNLQDRGVHADTVEILHILHGARDYASILFPDE